MDSIHVRQSDTDHGGHDTGAFGSTGTVVAGLATQRAAQALRDDILSFCRRTRRRHSRRLERRCRRGGRMRDGASASLPCSRPHGPRDAACLPPESRRERRARSRSTSRRFRIAVNKRSGAIKILRSVHAADAGRVINPMQCRGQVEGGVAQSLGAALYEEMVLDDCGRVINPTFRNYHLPQFGDVPRTEVLFADTSDSVGPFGAKSMSESPYNPVAAALGNALADATGIRFCTDTVQARSYFPRDRGKIRYGLTTSGPPLATDRSRDFPAPLLRRGATRPHARQPSVRRHPGERGGRRADRDGKRLPAGSRHDRARGAAAGDASVQAIWQPTFLPAARCTLPPNLAPCAPAQSIGRASAASCSG